MSSNYIDLVAIKHNAMGTGYIFQAPAWSHLENGDKVIVDTKYGEKEGIVIGVITVNKDTDDKYFKFVAAISGLKTPLKKVLYKINPEKLYYAEDSESEENAND